MQSYVKTEGGLYKHFQHAKYFAPKKSVVKIPRITFSACSFKTIKHYNIN